MAGSGGTDPDDGYVTGRGIGECNPLVHGGCGEGPGEGGAEGEGVD